MIIGLIGFVLGILLSVIALIVVIFATRAKLQRKLQVNKFRGNHLRLQQAVSELMSRVDLIDQESKFLNTEFSLVQKEKLQNACNELVVVTDSLKNLEKSIKHKDWKYVHHEFLSILNRANVLQKEIQKIREEMYSRRVSGS